MITPIRVQTPLFVVSLRRAKPSLIAPKSNGTVTTECPFLNMETDCVPMFASEFERKACPLICPTGATAKPFGLRRN